MLSMTNPFRSRDNHACPCRHRASGHVGRYAGHQLLPAAWPPSDVIAAVRTRDKAAGLAAAGVQVREAQTLGAKGKLRGIELGVASGRPG